MEELIIIEPKWVNFNRCAIVEKNGAGIVEIEIPNTQDGKIGYIWDLFVVPEHRSKGLATKLLAEAEKYIKSQGLDTAVLDWDEKDSPLWVYRWYERKGYKETEFGKQNARLRKRLK